MKLRNVCKFGTTVSSCVAVVLLLWTSLVVNGDEPLKEIKKKAGSSTGDVLVSQEGSGLEIIDRIVERHAYRRSEIFREIKKSRVSSGRVAIRYLRERVLANPDRKSTREVRICLEILRCMPDPESLDVLEEYLEVLKNRKHAFKGMREVLYTMALQEGGVARIEKYLDSSNDELRAAAIEALCCVYPDEKIEALIRRFRKDENTIGRATNHALQSARLRLDLIRYYMYEHPSSIGWDYASFAGRLKFLLAEPVYDEELLRMYRFVRMYRHVGRGDVYRLSTDPSSVFVWEQLQCLWHKDPQQMRKLLQQEIERLEQLDGDSSRADMIRQLLEDLSVGTCPPFDPVRCRCKPWPTPSQENKPE